MKTTVSLIVTAVLLARNSADGGQKQPESKPEFQNETGWVWLMEPQPASWASTARAGVLLRLEDLKDDKLGLNMAYPAEIGRDVVKFRPVAFNAAGERFVFGRDGVTSTKQIAQELHTLEGKQIPRDRIEFLGIEKLTKDNLQNVIAPTAFRKLKEAGIDCLPYPVIGKPYPFSLNTIEGKRITSSDLQGKVVLLDFWARWCGPCMAKMPKLKETYRKSNPNGLEIIGINHDHSLAEARRVIAKQELVWPHVLVPVDQAQRQLWEQATGVFSIPRLLLLDRDGILRADVTPNDLQSAIDKVLMQP